MNSGGDHTIIMARKSLTKSFLDFEKLRDMACQSLCDLDFELCLAYTRVCELSASLPSTDTHLPKAAITAHSAISPTHMPRLYCGAVNTTSTAGKRMAHSTTICVVVCRGGRRERHALSHTTHS